RARIVRELGAVPAYATLVTGAPEDVEPVAKRKRTLRGSLTAPQEPGEQLSRDEFQELVRDLDVDQRSGAAARQTEVSRTGVAEPALAPQPEEVAEEQRDPAADLQPEDLVLKPEPKRREKRRRPRNRRHGRSR